MQKLLSALLLVLAPAVAAAQNPGDVFTYRGPTLTPEFMPVQGSGTGNVSASGSFVVGNLYKANTTNGQSALDSGVATADVFTLAGTQSVSGSKTFNSALSLTSGMTISGTVGGNFIFSGVPVFSGLSNGTQTRCLGLDSGNHLVTAGAACGSGGGGGISGLTTGQVGIAGSASTLTSSIPFGTTGGNTLVETDSGGHIVAGVVPAFTGDITNTAGSLSTTIPANTVTNPKLAQGLANTVKGNFSSSTANVTDNAMPGCPDTGGNHLNYVPGTGISCGTSGGGGGSVSVTASTPDIVVAPTPGTGTFTIGTTNVFNDQSGGNYSIVTGDGGKTVEVGNHTYTIPQAGTTGFGTGWGTCLLNVAGSGNATVNTTTSVFKGAGGATSLTLAPGAWACPGSDGADYVTARQ